MNCNRGLKFKKVNKNEYLLVGSPNTGKSTIFNRLTNQTTLTGNFERTTVLAKKGKIKSHNSYLVDLPGVYNINSTGEDDEITTKNIFNFNNYQGIVNVINANSFVRDMHLVIQLLETEKPVILSINMVDELKNKKILFDKLAKKLNTPVILTVAKKSKGLETIKKQLNCPLANFKLNYGEEVENKISEIIAKLTVANISKRFLAIQLLENNEIALKYLKEHEKNYLDILNIIENKSSEVKEYQIIYNVRLEYVKSLYHNFFIEKLWVETQNTQTKISKKIDKLLFKRIFGLPLFILILASMYYLTFGPYTGGYLNSQIDYLLNTLVLENIYEKLLTTNCPVFLSAFLCHGFLAGVFAVIPFLPYILFLFLFVGILQQSGYLARVSVLTDQLLHPFGLSGRSVINLISGMGCNVPTILMSRNSINKKEKFISRIIAPFISCSARATVFAFVASFIFPKNVWLVVFLLQLFSGFVALLVGLGFSKTMFRKNSNFFLIEIPKWRMPDFYTISKLIYLETKSFLIRAGKFVLIGSIIVWLLSHLGPQGMLTDNQIGVSFVGYLGKGISYIFLPLGLNDWRMVVTLLLAFPAKELAIANMTIIFIDQANIASYFNLANGISFILFFLLYMPCLATMATIKKETNWRLLSLNVGLSLLIAYIIATIGYWCFYWFI